MAAIKIILYIRCKTRFNRIAVYVSDQLYKIAVSANENGLVALPEKRTIASMPSIEPLCMYTVCASSLLRYLHPAFVPVNGNDSASNSRPKRANSTFPKYQPATGQTPDSLSCREKSVHPSVPCSSHDTRHQGILF